jgi:hypothetical protein
MRLSCLSESRFSNLEFVHVGKLVGVINLVSIGIKVTITGGLLIRLIPL